MLKNEESYIKENIKMIQICRQNDNFSFTMFTDGVVNIIK